MISVYLIKQKVLKINLELTAIEISNTFPFMFFNYNGIRTRDGEFG